MRRAIEEPTRQLADNAGREGALVVEEVKKRKGNEGYDVANDEYTDLVKAGIVDPTKVTRCCAAKRRVHRGPVAHHRSIGHGDS